MKNLILVFLLFFGLRASAQLDALNVYYMAPNGFGFEVGKYPKAEHYKPVGYFFGVANEFGDKVTKGYDLTVYAKGQVYMIKYVHAVAQLGLEDFINLQFGLGVRGMIPIKGQEIFIEPLWKTNGSRLNLGFRFKI